MKFREHRGNLEESMEAVVELEPTGQAIIDHINKLRALVDAPPISAIEIDAYGFDARIGWETFSVRLPGGGVLGFTDEMPGKETTE